MEKFDVAVIGGGPGGYVAAIKAAQNGKKVCLIEKSKLGGVCLNQGCIPTKAMLKSVEILNSVQNCAEFGVLGVNTAKATIDIVKLHQRKKQIIQQLTGGVSALLKANGVKVITGNASFVGQRVLKVDGDQIEADNIIIATGSTPARLPLSITGETPLSGNKDIETSIITSEEALELEEIPETMVIIGGGVVGIEFAYIYANLGTKVTIIEMMDRILPMVDEEVTERVTAMLKKTGIDIFTSAKVVGIAGTEVSYEHDGIQKKAEGKKVLVSIGRVPNTDALNLECLGLKMNGKAIDVDQNMRTNMPGLYAIGDVNGTSMLAHTASMEGIIAVENILGRRRSIDYSTVPSCIHIYPDVAFVGLTEKQAKEKHGEIKVGRFPLAANGKALVEGTVEGLIKVIVDAKYGEIVGVHIYGIHAVDMIGEMVVAMNLEATAEEIIWAIHPHPTISEIIPEAFHAVLGKAIHAV